MEPFSPLARVRSLLGSFLVSTERSNKSMQQTKRKALEGEPASRASVINSRFAADAQRSPSFSETT